MHMVWCWDRGADVLVVAWGLRFGWLAALTEQVGHRGFGPDRSAHCMKKRGPSKALPMRLQALMQILAPGRAALQERLGQWVAVEPGKWRMAAQTSGPDARASQRLDVPSFALPVQYGFADAQRTHWNGGNGTRRWLFALSICAPMMKGHRVPLLRRAENSSAAYQLRWRLEVQGVTTWTLEAGRQFGAWRYIP